MPGPPQGNGFSGNNFSGGGVSGAGAAGFQGNAGGISGMGGFSGINGGIGGGHVEYFCSRCRAKVSQFATRCPNCGAIFTGTTLTPGSGPSTQPGGIPPQNNTGSNPPLEPIDNQRPDNKPNTDNASTPTASSSTPSSSSSEEKGSGLGAGVIIGASIAALMVFGLIAVIVVVASKGKAPAQKRGRRFRDADDY
jgi:hypothetical protein